MNLRSKEACFLILLLIGLTGCTGNRSSDQSDKKFSIYIMNKDGRQFVVQTSRLDQGLLDPEKDGVDVSERSISRELIVRNGYYYRQDRKRGTFIKYKIQDKKLIEVATVALPDFSLENYFWKGADTLLLTGLNSADFSQVKYAIVATNKLSKVAAGNMDIPGPSGRFDNMSVGFAEVRGQEVLLGYTYHQQLSASNYTTSDTTFITRLAYPSMKAISTGRDTRSAYPGGINTTQPYSFTDEAGDYYFITSPGIALGNRPELASGLFRIKPGSGEPDKGYFFNLSASAINNHPYGIWYLGDNKAIVRTERKDLFKGLSDHHSTAHFEFYVIDIAASTVKKLELPLDKGTRRQCIVVDNDLAYIAVNSPQGGNYIWAYTIKTGALKKGARLIGDTDFILRIDQLKP